MRTLANLVLAHTIASYTALGILILWKSHGTNDYGGLICIGLLAPLLFPWLALAAVASVFDLGHLSTEPLVVVGIYLVAFFTTLKLRSIDWSSEDRIPTGLCQVCRYDLTGNVSGVCPECGWRFKPKPVPPKKSDISN